MVVVEEIMRIFIGTIVFIVVATGFAVWWNLTLGVPLANSDKFVRTCQLESQDAQKARIENDLTDIANNKVEVSKTTERGIKGALKEQSDQNASDIYNALDAAHCSRSQIVKDLPELERFFQEYPR